MQDEREKWDEDMQKPHGALDEEEEHADDSNDKVILRVTGEVSKWFLCASIDSRHLARAIGRMLGVGILTSCSIRLECSLAYSWHRRRVPYLDPS